MVNLWHVIVAGNTAAVNGNDCVGTLHSFGYNLVKSGGPWLWDGTSITNGNLWLLDPLLGPLQDNTG